MGELERGNEIEVEHLWEILPQKAIGIFVRPAFPSMIGICKIYRHARFLLNTFPPGKFDTVVERECEAFLSRQTRESLDRKRGEEIRTHFWKEICDEVSASAIHEGRDAHALVPSEHRVAFPITETASTLHHGWPFIDTPLPCCFASVFSDLGSATPSIFP